MYPGPESSGVGTVCLCRALGRGGRRAGEELCISIAHPPLGLPVLCSPDQTPATGECEGQKRCYRDHHCVIYHLLSRGMRGRAASAQRLCVSYTFVSHTQTPNHMSSHTSSHRLTALEWNDFHRPCNNGSSAANVEKKSTCAVLHMQLLSADVFLACWADPSPLPHPSY